MSLKKLLLASISSSAQSELLETPCGGVEIGAGVLDFFCTRTS